DGSKVLQHVFRRSKSDPRGFLPNVLEAYDPRTGKLLETSDCPGLVFYRAVLSHDVRFIASVFAKDIAVFACDSAWRKLITLRNDGRKHFTGIAFHPSGKYLAATSNAQTVKLYDTTTWQVAKTYTWNIGRMRSIAFSPDGTLAAAGSDSGKIVV